MGDLRDADEAVTLQRELLEETLDECERMLAEADAAAAEIRQVANQHARELSDGFVRLTGSVAALHEEAAALLEEARQEADGLIVRAHDDAAELQAELLAELDLETSDRLAALDRQIATRLAEADRDAAARIARADATAAEHIAAARDQPDIGRTDQVTEGRAASEALVQERLAEAERASAALIEEARAIAADLIAEAEQEVTERRQQTDAAVDARLLDAETQYTDRLAQAEAAADARLLDADAEYTKRLAEANTVINQRLLEAYHEARAIVESAEAEVTAKRAGDAPGTALATPDKAEPVDVEHDEAPPAPATGRQPRRRSRWARGLRVIILVTGVLLASELIRAFVAAPYTVASTSMEPGLNDGVRVVVNKLAFRLGDPERGDVVAFDSDAVASDARGDTMVKRVIGVPGDVVTASDGRVVVNDEPLDEPWEAGGRTGVFGPFLVPEGTVFVLGDNRELSVDSRTFGVVPIDDVVGRVDFVFWPPGQVGGV